MIISFGALAAFFLLVVGVLHFSRIRDRTFSDYAVGSRAFDARFQAMSFLNTWYPGAIFTAFGGMAASAGVISYYLVVYSLLTVVLMYLMARPVWLWGKAFDLKTQPDLLALRYGSRHIRTLTGIVGIVSGLPWLILGMVSLGVMFEYLSLGQWSRSTAVAVGVGVIALRQVWTVRLGMRGVVISDMVQGVAAYIFGTGFLIWLIYWLVNSRGITFSSLPSEMFALPGLDSEQGPLYLFSLLLTGTIGGWCWPVIFVRLFTADGVRSLKKSAVLAVPISFVFATALLTFGMLGSAMAGVAERPEAVFFEVSQQAAGALGLGLAGVIVLAASMGNIDGHIQATGAQIANDLVGNYRRLSQRQLIWVAKIGMVLLTLFSAWVAQLELPALFTIAILAYQGIIQIAVPQFLGIFWKRGNVYGACTGMLVGFVVAVLLEFNFPNFLPWAYGLTSGVVALVVNLVIYVVIAYLVPQSGEEKARVEALFARVSANKSDAPELTDIDYAGARA